MKQKTLINDGWYFVKGCTEPPSELPRDAERIDLPHTWNAEDGTDGGNDYFRGSCLYMRELSLKNVGGGEKYYLEFHGVNSVARVFCNGKELIEHKGGYSKFRAELTPYLKEKNLIAVLVDNSHRADVYPAMADFTFYGGIYRDVYVISLHSAHFELDSYGSDGIKLTPTLAADGVAELAAEVFVENATEHMSLLYEVEDMEGHQLICETVPASECKRSFKIEKPRLWQGREDPYLYTAHVSLKEGAEVLDAVSVRFGIRSFSVDPERGFILNGKPYPLRGVSRHQDRAGVGNALRAEHHIEDVDMICELGASAVRLAHYQHDGRFYELCDERGLVVWAEIPYISKHESAASANAELQLKELIVQNYNHPSICFWGLSNEISMGGGADAELVASHKKLNELAKSLDPTRKTGIACVSMCDPDSPYTKIPDVVGYNHYFGWYGGRADMNGPWFDRFHAEHPKTPVGVTEYGCEALDWHSSEPRQGDYTEEYQAYYHEEMIKQLYSRPYLFATFVWNMFDFGADARAEGGEWGLNHKGLVTFDRRYKKDAFYAYKANLSTEPFVHIAGKRYSERAEDSTRVTVYSNQHTVELIVNGKSFATKSDPQGFFKFDVPMKGEIRIEARAGSCTDTAVFVRVEKFPEKYILKEKGAVLNWFDITAPEGYFSLNDELSEIMKTVKGKLWFAEFFSRFSKKLDTGMPMNDEMMKMLGGFSVLRLLNTVGSMAEPMSKEELLAINERLNKIKKP